MITFDHAQKLLIENAKRLDTVVQTIQDSSNHFLAEDILSPIDLPPFDQSAMDGYAIRYSDFEKSANPQFQLTGEIAAGSVLNKTVNTQETVRIFTGAQVPADCDTIIMQEYAKQNGATVYFEAEKITQGNHIRKQAEQLRSGQKVLSTGQILNPSAISLIASLGLDKVMTVVKPRAKILVTGDELMKSGESGDGKIYESNGIMLQNLLSYSGIESKPVILNDSLDAIKLRIENESKDHDIILISGGVSVGDYDFTREAIKLNNFDIIFHGVSQKPGKPLLFAKKQNKYIFGLPGNPRSVFMCYCNFVYPFLNHISGSPKPFLWQIQTVLNHDYKKKDDGKTYILSGNYTGNSVEINGMQGSHVMLSLVNSNCLVRIDTPEIKAGDPVTIQLLPF